MSTRNPKSFTAIRDIARRGQDTLARIAHPLDYSHSCRGHHQFGGSGVPVVEHQAGPPQTLGELCLEIADGWLLKTIEIYRNARLLDEPLNPRMMSSPVDGLKTFLGRGGCAGKLHSIRRAMWHKNRGLTEETIND